MISNFYVALASVGLSIFTHQAQASNLQIDQLQNAIDNSGANWKAGEYTFATPGYEDERGQSIFGLIADPEQILLEAQGGWLPRRSEVLPQKIDWRNHNGHNWLPPVRNQGQCGSCTAFAALALMEAQINIAAGEPNLNIDLSEQNLFSRIGLCSRGSMPSSAMSQMRYTGVPDESCQPYISGRIGADQSSSKACSDRSERSFALNSYQSVAPYNLKWALQYGPVLTTMTVYEDFKYYKSGVYKHVSGNALGGHAVLLVGYDDYEQAWIVRNSWGKNWGENGYFRISYKAASKFGLVNYRGTVKKIRSFAKLMVPTTLAAIQSTANFTIKRFGSSAQNDTAFSALIANNSDQFKLNFPVGQYAVAADLTPLKDGVYTVRLRNTSQSIRDSFSRVIVAKNSPNIQTTVKAEFDTSKPVAGGKLKFIVNASPSDVPATRSDITLRNNSGETVKTYMIPNPGQRSKFSLYADKLADGEYEVIATHRVGTLYSYPSAALFFTVQK